MILLISLIVKVTPSSIEIEIISYKFFFFIHFFTSHLHAYYIQKAFECKVKTKVNNESRLHFYSANGS